MFDHHSENLVKYAIAPKEHCARAAGGFSITTVSASQRPPYWTLEETEAEQGALF